MTTNMTVLPQSDLAIPPGELLEEELDARGMSQAEFARRIGRPPQMVNEIIRGKKQITHDTALEFERVLVIENGRVVEDDSPAVLAERSGSRYQSLLAAERDVREGLWGSAVWRRLIMDRGRLTEGEPQG